MDLRVYGELDKARKIERDRKTDGGRQREGKKVESV